MTDCRHFLPLTCIAWAPGTTGAECATLAGCVAGSDAYSKPELEKP